MFGYYRTMLAVWVMLFHLVSVPVIGRYAVFAFFVLSGFLMTLIMQHTYGYGVNGLQRYALNRILRLYPMYWAIGLFSVLIIYFVSQPYSLNYKNALSFPATPQAVLANVLMVFPAWIPSDVSPRLSPPTWALTVELFFYLCIGLGLSKNRKITCVWLMSSIAYFIFSYLYGLSGAHRYGSIIAASLPFSLGAFAFHYKIELLRLITTLNLHQPMRMFSLYVLNALIFCLVAHYQPLGTQYLLEIGRYSNLLLAMCTTVVLFFNGKELFSKKLDKVVGDFSYPIYLCHWQCGLLASYLLFDEPTRGLTGDGVRAFTLAILFTLVLSSACILVIDNNISTLRNHIKAKKSEPACDAQADASTQT